MTKRQKRKIVIIALLLLLLLALAWYFLYFRSTKKLGFDVGGASTAAVISPPQYLFSFNGGAGGTRMQRPVGVLADGNDVYVVDSARHTIDVFNLEGDYKRSFGTSETVVPLYIAKNPKDGNLYVTDRRARSVHIFTTEGKLVGDFDPKLPADQLPDFETQGYQWAPVSVAFADDGTMYATEILNGHRLLVFSPSGTFEKSTGTVGMVTDAEQGTDAFQFPNGIAFHDNEVYITDSNNRRVKVYDKAGDFDRIIVTQGLPRGISFLSAFPSDEETSTARFVVVDTLAHDCTIWTTTGEEVLSFGQQGIGEGQFSYPNGVSVGGRNRIFVADTANGRVQVWGWPDQVSPVPVPTVPRNWWYCLLPLLLLPLLLLLRKKKFFVTRDFVFEMIENEQLDLMPARNRKWFVTQDDYERLKDVKQGDVDLSELLHEMEHSESDVRAMMEKLEIVEEQAVVLTLAKRSRVFATEDSELRRLAKTIELDVVNREEFIERFTKKSSAGTSGSAE